jgi:hypothetical protein
VGVDLVALYGKRSDSDDSALEMVIVDNVLDVVQPLSEILLIPTIIRIQLSQDMMKLDSTYTIMNLIYPLI